MPYADPAKAREYGRMWARRWRAANPERAREVARLGSRRWRENNPEQWREHAAKARAKAGKRPAECSRKWRQEHPERALALDRRTRRERREREREAAPVDPNLAREWTDVLVDDACVYCGSREGLLHIDHIEALSGGGTGDWDNLTSACKSCNSSKHAAPLLRFLLRVRGA